ncbi:MAG: SPFH domain-containing protein [Phycisphaerae bacterium]
MTKSLADAVNYQFGFEVSSTWFYQLLQRWMLPIMVLTALAIFMLTSIVIVSPDERVVVERFGKVVGGPTASLEPGLYFKWPYPIDVIYRAPVTRTQEIVIGEASEDEHEDHAKEASLWTEAHDYVPELMLLVASEKDAVANDSMGSKNGEANELSQSSPMSLLMVSVPIQYRIKNIQDYLYQYDQPEKLLEAEAYRILSEYASGVDIAELMGPGRETFNREFRDMLQARIDELNVGFELVFAGVADAHPPAKNEVANSFQSVIQAQIQQDADVQRAEGEARRILVRAAGTVTRAKELDAVITEMNELKKQDDADAEVVASLEAKVESLLFGDVGESIAPPGGQVAKQLADARARASRDVSKAAAKVRKFSTEVAAYEAAPELYLHRKHLAVYENLGFIRRYLIAGDPESVLVTYTTQQDAALDQVLAEEEEQ